MENFNIELLKELSIRDELTFSCANLLKEVFQVANEIEKFRNPDYKAHPHPSAKDDIFLVETTNGNWWLEAVGEKGRFQLNFSYSRDRNNTVDFSFSQKIRRVSIQIKQEGKNLSFDMNLYNSDASILNPNPIVQFGFTIDPGNNLSIILKNSESMLSADQAREVVSFLNKNIPTKEQIISQ